MYSNRQDIRAFIAKSDGVVAISIDNTKGSTPRNSDAWMLVSSTGIFRTIGGGSLEFMAIDKARALLRQGGDHDMLSIPLGPEIGQCCGGHVCLKLERLSPEGQRRFVNLIDHENAALVDVYVFGAGHVGNALVEALSLLPVHPVLVDTRSEELKTAPHGIDTCLTPMPEDVVRSARPGSAYIILTHDHSLDFLITTEALNRADASYVGMIGSKTKRAVFARWFDQETDHPVALEQLVCPIGKTSAKDKRPEVIASFVAAEVMECLIQFSQTQSMPRALGVAQEDA